MSTQKSSTPKSKQRAPRTSQANKPRTAKRSVATVGAKKTGATNSKKAASRSTPAKTTIKSKKANSSRSTAKASQTSRSKRSSQNANGQTNTTTSTRSLLILSPFRFPLDIDTVARQTARYGGALFVFLGAVFTLWHTQYAFSDTPTGPQMAATSYSSSYSSSYSISSDDYSSSYSISISSDDDNEDYGESAYSRSSGPPRITDDSRPFKFAAKNPVSGDDVRVRVRFKENGGNTIEDATLSARNVTTGQVYDFGGFSGQSNNWWEHFIDTTVLQDGEYRFVALADYKDPDGAFYPVTISDSKIRQVTNHSGAPGSSASGAGSSASGSSSTSSSPTVDPSSGTSTDSTSGTSSAASTSSNNTSTASTVLNTNDLPTDAADTASDAVNKVVSDSSDQALNFLGSIPSPLSGTVRFTITAAASDVKVNLFHVDTERTYQLGYAYEVDTDTWRVAVDTTEYPNGEYRLLAHVIVNGNITADPSTTITIENEVATEAELESKKPSEEVPDTKKDSIDAKTNPDVTLKVLGTTPVSGRTTVSIAVTNANYIELYARPRQSGTERYLGNATQADTGVWNYRWDTTNVPNGEYLVVGKIRTPYGVFTEATDWITVKNDFSEANTPKDEAYAEKAKSANEVARVNTTLNEAPKASASATETESGRLAPASENGTSAETSVPTASSAFKQYGADQQAELESALQAFAAAYRSGDQDAVAQTRDRINQIKAQVQAAAEAEDADQATIARIDEHLDALIKRVEADVEKSNVIVTQRTQIAAQTDRDNDGITDFDEVTLYQTDPRSADSDGDGFVDGAEILSGYDPTDPTPEVAVAYESPKESGVVREDLVQVKTIRTEPHRESSTSTEAAPSAETTTEAEPEPAAKLRPAAVITGTALPNSFVTLYIFSTPIIVTVRTDADGSWSYRFDKELPDGEHQVYAGITDNAGRIVAKSDPLFFIKEAEAFSQVDAPAPGTTVAQNARDGASFGLQPVMLLVASISVVSIGLVLLLLGVYMDRRRDLTLTEDAEAITS